MANSGCGCNKPKCVCGCEKQLSCNVTVTTNQVINGSEKVFNYLGITKGERLESILCKVEDALANINTILDENALPTTINTEGTELQILRGGIVLDSEDLSGVISEYLHNNMCEVCNFIASCEENCGTPDPCPGGICA